MFELSSICSDHALQIHSDETAFRTSGECSRTILILPGPHPPKNPFSAANPKLICSGDGVGPSVRPSVQLSVMTSISSALAPPRPSPVQRERAISKWINFLRTKQLKAATAILSGKRQKSFMRQRERRRRRPTACCTSLSLSGPSFSVWCVSQCTDAVSFPPSGRESYHIGRRRSCGRFPCNPAGREEGWQKIITSLFGSESSKHRC